MSHFVDNGKNVFNFYGIIILPEADDLDITKTKCYLDDLTILAAK